MVRSIQSYLLLLALCLAGGACKEENKATAPANPSSATAGNGGAADKSGTVKAPPPGEPGKPAAEDEVSGSTITNPFFFRVSGPNEAAGYLLGTMHMGIDAEKDFPAEIWKARDAATLVAVEADIMDPGLAAGMMLPKDTNLKVLLGDEHWAKLEEALGPMQAQAMMPMKPAAAASMLAMKDLPMTMPMDLLIMMKSQAAKQDLQFLETAQFQLELLDRVMSVDFLKQMLDEPDPEASKKMLEAYRRGDLQALEDMTNDPKAWGTEADAKTNMELMLFKRNDDWIPKLEAMFGSKNAFVAVGAAHLIGPRGVIELLKKKGYTVERVAIDR